MPRNNKHSKNCSCSGGCRPGVPMTHEELRTALAILLAQGRILYCPGCEKYRDASLPECGDCSKEEDPMGMD